MLIIQAASAVLSLIAIAGVFIWAKHGLFPVLGVKIELDQKSLEVVLIRLIVENTSQVNAKLDKDRGKARLQILEYDTEQMARFNPLSAWVPFEENDVGDREQPKEWKEPVPIMATTEYIEPGETIRQDFLFRPSAPGLAIHCGAQVLLERHRIAELLTFMRRIPSIGFTSTAWMLAAEGYAIPQVAAKEN